MAKFAILGNNAILVIREIFAKDTGKYKKKKLFVIYTEGVASNARMNMHSVHWWKSW